MVVCHQEIKKFQTYKVWSRYDKAGVKAYRRLNPGSKLKTAVTGKVKPGSKLPNVENHSAQDH